MDVSGRRIVVMGLGRHGGGVAAARWLAESGAHVTVTDLADAAAIQLSLAALADVPIANFTLGRHAEHDFLSADAVVVNPAVRPDHPLLALARSHGIPLTSEIELFLERCRARVIGVTGTNGKSTTASMLAAILHAAPYRVWLGGNIGVSLLGKIEEIRSEDLVVLELSSFQLAHLREQARFPEVAIITNCTPNHLDWHRRYVDYAAAKRRLVDRLPIDGFAVLNMADAELERWCQSMTARVVSPWPLERIKELRVPGAHNLLNAACAAATAEVLGASTKVIDAALSEFDGLKHRLLPLRQVVSRRFIDDSKSTTPEATLAALSSCEGPVWVLIGGHDKGTDFRSLFTQMTDLARGAAFYGTCGRKLQRLANEFAPELPTCYFRELTEAFLWCCQQSSSGDVILLSPGCASFDQFRDFEHRAEAFARCVQMWHNESIFCSNKSGT